MNNLFSWHVPILLYHEISSEDATREGSDSITVEHFERQMRYLYEHGYQCLSLAEYLRSAQQGKANGRKAFVLTFDDGRVDFLTLAYPVLRRYGFSATMFVVIDYLERKNEKPDAPLLTWEQVSDLSGAGITFGSHTCTHPHLRSLASDQIRSELSLSKQRMEDRLGQKISFLSYPFGESNHEIRKITAEVGYKAACGVTRGEQGLYNLWRCTCNRKDTSLTFAFKLTRWFQYWLRLTNWIRDMTPFVKFVQPIRARLFSWYE
jgi:peptidoglycan/xylan/chitin deacetylase (PgdA/CDA1 family)